MIYEVNQVVAVQSGDARLAVITSEPSNVSGEGQRYYAVGMLEDGTVIGEFKLYSGDIREAKGLLTQSQADTFYQLSLRLPAKDAKGLMRSAMLRWLPELFDGI